jgi:hypothetical protein
MIKCVDDLMLSASFILVRFKRRFAIFMEFSKISWGFNPRKIKEDFDCVTMRN